MKGLVQDRTGTPSRQIAPWFALLGSLLLGIVIGGWVDPSGAPAAAAGVWWPAAGSVGIVLAAVFVIAAAVLLRHSRGKTAHDDAVRDAVTGLYLPMYADEAVAGLVARDDRNGRSQTALVHITIDVLDEARQRHGNDAVATLLAAAGRHVRSQSREGDLPMRDGDTVLVYLQCEEIDQAAAFCRRLGMLLSGEQLSIGDDVWKIAPRMRIALRHQNEALDDFRRRAYVAPDLVVG